MNNKLKESDIIKLSAAVSAAPRWVTALIIADGAQFIWGDDAWWRITSALASLVFAIVETYAAAYMMRSWRDTGDKVLGVLWVTTLIALTAVVAPPIYANTMQVDFNSLPWWIVLTWSVCVASSTFLVIGGVGYADRVSRAPTQEPKVELAPVQERNPSIIRVAPSGKRTGQITQQVVKYLTEHPEEGPTAVSKSTGVKIGTVKSIQAKIKAGKLNGNDANTN